MLASLKADTGAYDEALDIARRLQALHPDEATPYALEAELLARRGDFAGASAVYDRALAIQITQHYAIRSYQMRKEAELADQLEPLVAFLRERPLDNNMRIFLAQAYQRQDEIGNANAEYERVLSQEPENFIAANNLALNYFEEDDPRAEQAARRAYGIQPDNSSVVDTLGWILVKKGELQDGIAMLRDATEINSNTPEIHYHLAAGLAAAGEAEEAKNILQEILAKEVEFTSRQEAENLLTTL